MKKIVIPIIIAAVLGAGGVVTAVALNKPSTAVADNEVGAPEIAEGKYYLNGDKESGIYFEFTDDYLALRVEGNAVEKVKEFVIQDEEKRGNEVTDEWVTEQAQEIYSDFGAENPYVVGVFGNEYQLMIHWREGASGPTYSGCGFPYDGYKTIKCSPFGEFKLVE